MKLFLGSCESWLSRRAFVVQAAFGNVNTVDLFLIAWLARKFWLQRVSVTVKKTTKKKKKEESTKAILGIIASHSRHWENTHIHTHHKVLHIWGCYDSSYCLIVSIKKFCFQGFHHSPMSIYSEAKSDIEYSLKTVKRVVINLLPKTSNLMQR